MDLDLLGSVQQDCERTDNSDNKLSQVGSNSDLNVRAKEHGHQDPNKDHSQCFKWLT